MNKLNNPSSILDLISSTNELIDKTLQKQDNITSSTNIDTLVEGIYYISSTPSNLPNGLKYLIQLGSTIQIAFDQTTGIIYHRAKVGDAFSDWYSCADYEDIPSVGNGTITITQGGVTKGTFTTNQSGNLTIDLDAGSVSGTLTNIATGANSLIVSGAVESDAQKVTALGKNAEVATGNYGANSVVIGYGAKCGDAERSDYGNYSVALGQGAIIYGSNNVALGQGASVDNNGYGIAIGSGAVTRANNAIQLGKGTNAEDNSLYVSVGLSDSRNYKMLDVNGKIPDDRLNTTIARTSQIPTVPTKTSDLTNDSGYITGITSSDVTTALGYTPYDSSNPSGYTTNAGTVTSVNNVSPVNGNVTLSIPAAQIQSDWTQTTTTAKDYIKNKPNLATVATSGSYNDLSNKPTIPSVGNATITITQGGINKGSFTTNQSSSATIALDAGGGTATTVKINGTSITSSGVADIKTNGTYNSSSNKIATMSDVPTNTNQLTNGAGFITGINSTDVTTALGYTPANTTLSNLGATSSTNFDGQWGQKHLTVSTATSVGSREHDLSSYLPNDNYSYEVMFNLVGSTNTNSCGLTIGTVASPSDNASSCFFGILYTSSNARQARNFVILPIDTTRKVYTQITSNAFYGVSITACGYRRIGTNT